MKNKQQKGLMCIFVILTVIVKFIYLHLSHESKKNLRRNEKWENEKKVLYLIYAQP